MRLRSAHRSRGFHKTITRVGRERLLERGKTATQRESLVVRARRTVLPQLS